ncbi:hypothetical protein ATJ97_2192 [Georgenia soli]|uniref:Uncharacterized protein n=1 Tax=Georgenia soli TaxID=638953 RepID=A0A2A9EMC5_9MICO|nr:hypothetical protein ATJ97_2192 [Georgenia soli]
MAAVDLRGDRLVVYASSQTKDGFWITNGTFELLDHDAGDEELGAAVLRVLATSRSGVRTPNLRRAPSPFTPVLDALGLGSWNAYARGVRHVHVERTGSTVQVSPSRNGGAKEGFVGAAEPAAVVTDPTAEALGAAVRAVLLRST